MDIKETILLCVAIISVAAVVCCIIYATMQHSIEVEKNRCKHEWVIIDTQKMGTYNMYDQKMKDYVKYTTKCKKCGMLDHYEI